MPGHSKALKLKQTLVWIPLQGQIHLVSRHVQLKNLHISQIIKHPSDPLNSTCSASWISQLNFSCYRCGRKECQKHVNCQAENAACSDSSKREDFAKLCLTTTNVKSTATVISLCSTRIENKGRAPSVKSLTVSMKDDRADLQWKL